MRAVEQRRLAAGGLLVIAIWPLSKPRKIKINGAKIHGSQLELSPAAVGWTGAATVAVAAGATAGACSGAA
jgi:hypothetical protein